MFAQKSRLDRRLAVVTGGGGGIGLASAEALRERGVAVLVVDADAVLAERVRDELRDKGDDAEAAARRHSVHRRRNAVMTGATVLAGGGSTWR